MSDDHKTASVMLSQTAQGNTTPTFDATTQTSPMSLSPSSSFLWDCNCSIDSMGTAAVVVHAHGAGGGVGGRQDGMPCCNGGTEQRSLVASTNIATEMIAGVMDTSLSSLLSLSSDGGRLRRVTPDSAADADVDAVEGSSVSLSHSFDPLDVSGLESGIGTGSPPASRRLRRPIPLLCASSSSSTSSGVAAPAGEQGARTESDSCTDSCGDSSTDADGEEGADEHTSNNNNKKRSKVLRRETWEKIRRRNSCKRIQSGRRNKEIVWVPRAEVHKTTQVQQDSPSSDTDSKSSDRVLHKPPVKTTTSLTVAATVVRPKPKYLILPTNFDCPRQQVPAVLPPSQSPPSPSPSPPPLPALSSECLEPKCIPFPRRLATVAMKSSLDVICDLEPSNKSSSSRKVDSSDRIVDTCKPSSTTCSPTHPHVTLEV